MDLWSVIRLSSLASSSSSSCSSFAQLKWDRVSGFPPEQFDGVDIATSLYGGMDPICAEVLAALNEELMSVRNSVRHRFPALDLSTVLPLAERIRQQYGDQVEDYSTLTRLFQTARMYRKSKFAMTPVPGGDGSLVIPNVNHRHFTDDIPFGLCVVKDVAVRANVATPTIDTMIEWHQQLMGKEYIIDGHLVGADVPLTGVMGNYGVNSLEELVRSHVF